MDKQLAEPVLGLMERMGKVIEGGKGSTNAQWAAEAMGHLAKSLRPRVTAVSGDSAGAPVARNAALPTATHSAAAAGWPPPFAADKGMAQSLTIPGFAVTTGNGSAFVHMKPIQHFGATADIAAYRELAGRLAVAAELAAAALAALAPAEPEAAEVDEGDEGNDAAGVADDDEDEGRCDMWRGPHGSPMEAQCLLQLGHEDKCVFPDAPATPVRK